MKQFLAFVRKEFYHILRDRRTVMILLIMPIVMIILFGFALTTEVRNINVAVLSPEPDDMARQLVQRIEASEYFTVREYIENPDDIDRLFRKGDIDLVLAFGQHFSDNIFTPEGSQIQIVVDASDANMAQSFITYTSSVIADYYTESMPPNSANGIVPNVTLLYNPQMKSSFNFVPGIMGLILMLICAMMTSIAIVKEISGKAHLYYHGQNDTLFYIIMRQPDNNPVNGRFCTESSRCGESSCTDCRIPALYIHQSGTGTPCFNGCPTTGHSHAVLCHAAHGTHYPAVRHGVPGRKYANHTERHLICIASSLVYRSSTEIYDTRAAYGVCP